MIRFIKRVIVYLIIFYGLSILISIVLDFQIVRNKNVKLFWINGKKNETFSVAFLGSSRVNGMLDVDQVVEKYGNKIINLGNDGAGTYESFLIFKKFIEDNKLEKLFMQVDNTTFSERYFSYPFHEYQFLPYLNVSKSIRKALQKNFSTSKYLMWRFVPISKHVEFKVIYMDYLLEQQDTMHFDQNKGTKLYERSFSSIKPIRRELKNYQMDSISCSSLSGILDLAQSMNIEVVLYTAPFHNIYLENYEIPFEFIRSIADNREVAYYNFSAEKSIRDTKYFSDIGHLNIPGTIKFTSILLDTLTKKKL